ncbi:nSTAND1 domain-containing NTPase [Polyangium jinanense]|uniref:Protein kinase n=1 Tax=Polyangium jinanense TaxID=2829994 RepID=A0A9X3XD38_9BACT|nr:protein kinase [Polyangium jinanense]MDC3960766.1 protein kinase [Polyangium jinanense]MDC3985856.1 protein kinase [Polyangium jinanense]
MSAKAPRDHAPGELLDGRFLLLERLGRGGFGDVWRAEELLPDGVPLRTVALKLLQRTAYDAAHWAEEAKLLASFRHPSLVTIYAAGLLRAPEAVPFVAMELLEGKNLAEVLLQRKRVPWRRVLGWARATAAALDVIHVRGVVHLDLKPANLFVSNDGALKVLDFGISRRAGSKAPEITPPAFAGGDVAGLETAAFVAAQDERSSQPTRAQSSGRAVVGTPGYMAPEILELAEPTPAADAYALAATIVKLATGRMPYEDVADEPMELEGAAAMSAWWSDLRDATLRGRLRDLAADPAGLPRGLVALLVRLLSVDPLQRGVTPGKLAALFDATWERPYGVMDPPYTGLSALPKEAEGQLFGRDDDVARLGRELAFEPVVVLYGPRGAGKSSLASAGLVPHLARAAVDGKDDWIAVAIRPGEDPDHALDVALGGVDAALVGASSAEIARHAASSSVGIVLLVDPLEDALSAPEGTNTRLARLLADLAEGGERTGLRVLATLGEKHVANLADPAAPFASLRAALRFVGPPPAAAVHDIVTGPARLAGVRMSGADAIVADVQRELRGADDRLPLVALTLAAFWDKRVLSAETWRALGGLVGALAKHTEKLLASIDDASREIAIEAVLRLSTTDHKPIRWDEDELVSVLGEDTALVRRVITRLEREGLLRRRDGRVELSHPSIAALPRIEQVRSREAERLVLLERLRDAAIAWDRAAYHPDFLLTGWLFEEVERKPTWTRGLLTTLERQLVARSRRLARRRTMLKGASIALLLALLASAVVGKRAIDERQAHAERARVEAEERAYIAEVLFRSRRVDDPYHRAAWIAEAIEFGAEDPALPLDLLRAAMGLPRAQFLTLEPSTNPAFPWDDRWLVATQGQTRLVVVDLRFDPFYQATPPDSAEPAAAAELHPRALVVRPHDAPFVERVPLPFDTALATRSVTGEVRIFRLRPDGEVMLAAIAPRRCTGALEVADAAPVLACASENGLLRWDLRRAGEVDTHPFQGIVLDVSPDGSLVAAASGSKLVIWRPAVGSILEVKPTSAVVLARFGPREPLLALAEHGAFEIVDPARPETPLFRGPSVEAPSFLRWDEGGLDLAVCGTDPTGTDKSIVGRFHYLRLGGRAPGDALPKGAPCSPAPRSRRPAPIISPDEVPAFARVPIGPRDLLGGHRLENGHVVTGDLVLLSGATGAVDSLVRFRAEGGPAPSPTSSVRAVVRESNDVVAFQVDDEVRFYRVADGKRELGRKGNLLRRCQDGRVAAWEREGEAWHVFDARSGASIGKIPREPGLVLAVDSTCRTLYTQRLDGAIVATPLDGAASAPRVIASADGHVYDVRPSAARDGMGAGLWIAVSSGALARIDEATSEVRVLGYASPRATALGDGPAPGELVYADDTGVVVLRARGPERLLEASGATVWEDVSVAPDGRSMLLLSADRVVALDVARREIVGSMPLRGRTRFVPWDAAGSVLVWSFDRPGGVEGEVIPRGRPLADAVARTLSNLRVDRGRLGLQQ